MASLSKLRNHGGKIGGAAAVLAIWLIWKAQKPRKRQHSSESESASTDRPKKKPGVAAVDKIFAQRLMHLMKIMVPSIWTSEFLYVLVVAGCLVGRTFCDLWMIRTHTAIERSIITRDTPLFRRELTQFLLAMFPISFVNSLLRYSLSELQVRFRARLTAHLYKKYLSGFTFYRVSNLDSRIANIDQLLTQDVDKFTEGVCDLISNVSKPLWDLLIYARRLSSNVGGDGPVAILMWLFVAGGILTRVRKPMARYTVEEQKLEGVFRAINSRIITSSEEIAFYGGAEHEQAVAATAFSRLVNQLRRTMQFKLRMGVLDNVITKYCTTVVAFAILRHSFRFGKMAQKVQKEHGPLEDPSNQTLLMENYYTYGRMLVNFSEAVGRLVLASRDLTRLAGLTSRVAEVEAVLDSVSQGHYERPRVSQQQLKLPDQPDPESSDAGTTDKSQISAADFILSRGLAPRRGKIIESEHIIKFEEVPIVTPNGEVLIQSLNFEVRSGSNVLVSGPNGSGKSSLFRILSELWPVWGGTVTKPTNDYLFYIPQRPYMTIGTLREQLIYPVSVPEALRKGWTDEVLLQALKEVKLQHLFERELYGWNAKQDWMDVLSGGEKQRLAFARMLLHRPQFAILDECTSAVSVDVEGHMYDKCREMGITCFTVSHRKSLWKFHQHVLHFDGRGHVTFQPIETAEQFGS